jgi:hypothetical protein
MAERKRKIGPNIVYVIAWLLCSLLVIADVLVVREATLDVLTKIQTIRVENAPEGTGELHLVRIQFGSTIEAIDRAVIVIGSLVAVTSTVFIEHYFRVGLQKEDLLKRMLKTFAPLVGIIFIGVLVQTFV